MRVALPDSSLSAARRSLRAELAARRRAVSTDERVRAARRAALQADRALRLSAQQRIAVYAALLRENRLGIDEPEGSATIAARWLDLVFLPLLGFDRGGVRLGTGGGFYDRAFAFRQLRRVWHKPRLVGFGYAFQQVEHLTKAPHDVALDAVVTDEGFMRCATG